jgi:hypothetical protein
VYVCADGFCLWVVGRGWIGGCVQRKWIWVCICAWAWECWERSTVRLRCCHQTMHLTLTQLFEDGWWRAVLRKRLCCYTHTFEMTVQVAHASYKFRGSLVVNDTSKSTYIYNPHILINLLEGHLLWTTPVIFCHQLQYRSTTTSCLYGWWA